MTQRYCPHDRSALSLDSHEGLTGHRCKICEGAWFPRQNWGALRYEAPFSDQVFLEHLERAHHAISPLRCPEDNAALRRVKVDDVELDWCNTCAGIWFDRQEAAALRARYSGNGASGAIAVAGSEGLFWLLLSWLS